jgi:hypothetical protein
MTLPFTSNKSPKISEMYFFWDALVKWTLALGYLHAVFPLRVTPYLAETELPPPLPATTEMNGNEFFK